MDKIVQGKVRPLVHKPLSVYVNHHPEGIRSTWQPVHRVRRPRRGSICVYRRPVIPHPLTRRLRPNIKRRPVTVPRVVPRTPHLRPPPVPAQMLRPHLRTRLESPARQHHPARANLLHSFRVLRQNPCHRPRVISQQTKHFRLIHHLDSVTTRRRVMHRNQSGPGTHRACPHPYPRHHPRSTTAQLKFNPLLPHPPYRRIRLRNQRLQQVRVRPTRRLLQHLPTVVRRRVWADTVLQSLQRRRVRQQRPQVLRPVVRETEPSPRVRTVPAPLWGRRLLHQQHPRPLFPGGQRSAHRRIPSPHNNYVKIKP